MKSSTDIQKRLNAARDEFLALADMIDKDASLPDPKEAIQINIALNSARSALIGLDNILHRRHNERHPMPKPKLRVTCLLPIEPLDPETRAEIDATP